MTSMPEMVALLNGFGGGASVLVAGGALVVPESVSDAPPPNSTALVAVGSSARMQASRFCMTSATE